MPHSYDSLPEQQITPPEIGRTECWECGECVPTDTIVHCANPRCEKPLCEVCGITCGSCDAALCRHCATKPDIYGGGKGLCKSCQDNMEIEVEDE